MQIEVIPLGFLKEPLGQDRIAVEAEPRATVRDVLSGLSVRLDLVSTVIVNGEAAPRDTVLHDGDTVRLVPYTGAG